MVAWIWDAEHLYKVMQSETIIWIAGVRSSYNLCITKLKNKTKKSKRVVLKIKENYDKIQFELINSSQAISEARKMRKTEPEEKKDIAQN